ncbi:MAG: SUMF1/EgtB/PvdO family nonheme iron enzyme [Bryobacterales bacterium]|nr:SUMF1/EgtB/PvdO family nonheme iron enzyme [Bryobacterales bacterium]
MRLATCIPLIIVPILQAQDEIAMERSIALKNASAIRFRYIPPGSYLRGSPASEAGRDRDEVQHRVTITRGFYMAVHEVTQEQWRGLMGSNPAVFQQPVEGEDPLQRPVEFVSWNDCQRFLAKLNALGEGRFRLPTEAEWEYAARAGSQTRFWWGDGVRDSDNQKHAWANSRSYATTHPVGMKPSNAWGLFDMSGNVWEWCSDWYGPYPEGDQVDPKGPPQGKERVFRGGSYYDFPVSLRSANRHRHAPEARYTAIGLRLVLEAPR